MESNKLSFSCEDSKKKWTFGSLGCGDTFLGQHGSGTYMKIGCLNCVNLASGVLTSFDTLTEVTPLINPKLTYSLESK